MSWVRNRNQFVLAKELYLRRRAAKDRRARRSATAKGATMPQPVSRSPEVPRE